MTISVNNWIIFKNDFFLNVSISIYSIQVVKTNWIGKTVEIEENLLKMIAETEIDEPFI